MLKPVLRCSYLLPCMTWFASAHAAELALLQTPIKVTASLQALDEGGYAAQIGVDSGSLTQLVTTAVQGDTQAAAERSLRQHVRWRAPYLFVYSSCNGTAWRCEGATVFRVADGVATRLGDLIGTANAIYSHGHFHDVYDKLEQQVPGLSHAASPRFIVALDDTANTLTVNADITWSSNATAWREHAARIAALQPGRNWLDAEWEPYMSALLSNAALARYCKKTDELQQLLNVVMPALDIEHQRVLTDALSKVVPLERPKAWRMPY